MDFNLFICFGMIQRCGRFTFWLVSLKALKRLFIPMVDGGLQMNSPNFSIMTRKELRAYALVHREDNAVFRELIKRVGESGTEYPYPQTEEDLLEMKEVFRRKIAGDDDES
jgi:hypothetical protein